MTLRTTQGKFKFICNACHKHIKDGDGIVDYPIPGLSENKDWPIRHYHQGECARLGDKQRLEDEWYSTSISDFVLQLIRQHTTRESGSGKPCDFYKRIVHDLSKDHRSPLKQ
tara:strand:+ start:244 stop:579 length:336 start_codon:yes stop_codon:yes gene_type:complete